MYMYILSKLFIFLMFFTDQIPLVTIEYLIVGMTVLVLHHHEAYMEVLQVLFLYNRTQHMILHWKEAVVVPRLLIY